MPATLTDRLHANLAEATYSVAQTALFFGGDGKRVLVQELVHWGKVAPGGLHPLRGGLTPTFKVSHKARRIPQSAIDRHLAHMARLDREPAFKAQMRAKARALALPAYGRRPAETAQAA